VAEFRVSQQDELELLGDQHLLDRRQGVGREMNPAGGARRRFFFLAAFGFGSVAINWDPASSEGTPAILAESVGRQRPLGRSTSGYAQRDGHDGRMRHMSKTDTDEAVRYRVTGMDCPSPV
jgi:hypothetical protein